MCECRMGRSKFACHPRRSPNGDGGQSRHIPLSHRAHRGSPEASSVIGWVVAWFDRSAPVPGRGIVTRGISQVLGVVV